MNNECRNLQNKRSAKRDARSLLAILSIAAFLAPAVSTAAAENIEGRIASVDGDTIHACFDRSVNLRTGDEFGLIRHTILTQPKVATGLRSERVGAIRVKVLGNDRCAQVQLLHGSVKSLDWIAEKSTP